MRLLSQGADGIFEVALASTVWLTPERAPLRAPSLWPSRRSCCPLRCWGRLWGFWSTGGRDWFLVASNAGRAVLLLIIAPLVVRGDVGWLFYLLLLTAFWVNRFLLAALFEHSPRRRR